MYWIATLVLVNFVVLTYLARGQDVPEGTERLLRPFFKSARFLYKKLSLYFPRVFNSRKVEQDLRQLHPGEAVELLKTDYYVKKLALCLGVLVAGSVLGAAAKFSAQSNILLVDGEIGRGDYLEGIKEVNVTADYGQGSFDFVLQVEPRKLSNEETEALCEQVLEKLPEYILGENESLQQVRNDLVLSENYEGVPFQFSWKSHHPEVLSSWGRVRNVECAQQAVLGVTLTYGEYSREATVELTVVPPLLEEEALLYKEMEELLSESHGKSLEQEMWKLPAEIGGQEIRWKQALEDYSLLVGAATVIVTFLIYLCADSDLHEQLEKRRKSMRKEYPEIVHKLVLFVGAGMTLRGAFQKIATDYETKGKAKKVSAAYEEMLYTCHELNSGVSEGAAYERFGRRTGLAEYIRLSTLLMQNLKRGNSTLLERLREEADKAAEERLQQSKKLGEEAGTKLLVPMVLMLAVVMVMIMTPAFSAM